MKPSQPTPPDDMPRDPALGHLYRAHAQAEPSVAMDRFLRKAARDALSERASAEMRWWPRWRLRLSVAATLLLSVAISLLVERQSPSSLNEEAGLEQPRESTPAAAVAPQAESAPDTAKAPLLKSAAPRPVPMAHEHETQAMSPPSPVEAPKAATAGRLEMHAAEKMEARAQDASAGAAPPKESAPAVRATARPASQARADAASRPPAIWLDEIRALRREGKSEAAEQQLREFRRIYPDYPLPEDFQ